MTEQTERNGKKGFFQKYINGTKGVISLFLAILMVPFVMLAGVLIDAARIRSAVAIFDEALCNASNSTLGTYDQFLKERFGLLAMAQSSGDGSYNAQDFIEDTFNYYVQENLKTLNKAFTEYTAEAMGIYPLSQKDILRTEILEYSKYTVPTKLIINGLSIDSIISSLTSSMKTVSKILDTFTSEIDFAEKLNACQDKFNEAIATAENCENALSSGEQKFSSFESAASDYNDIVTEMLEERRKAEEALRAAQNHQSACQDDFDREAAANADVLDEIADLENEKDAEGNPVDNSERIAEIREAHKEELEAYDKAVESLEDAKKSTSGAEATLNGVKSDYAARLDTQRSVVGSSRDTYAMKLGELADALEQTDKIIKETQEAMRETFSSMEEFENNILSTGFAIAGDVSDDAIEEMKKNRDEAAKLGDDKVRDEWNKIIKEAENEKRKNDNVGTVIKSGSAKSVDDFTETDYHPKFQEAIDAVRSLQTSVTAYVLASGDDYMASTDPYKLKIELPVTAKNLSDIQENIANNLLESSFIKLLRAGLDFISSLTELTLLADRKLNANVNIAKVRKDSKYSNADRPEELDDDKNLSDKYKDIYGGVSSKNNVEEELALEDAIENLLKYLGELKKLIIVTSAVGLPVFGYIASLVVYLPKVIKEVKTIVNTIGSLGKVAYSRLLIAGYAGYNTSNRTTVGKSGLTGATFLTAPEESAATELFCGAETEYLITGLGNEKASQRKVFRMIYQIRFMMNLPFVFTNKEVETIAAAAGSATCGVGAAFVYFIYMFLEPLVDTLLLVNAKSVPIFKTTLYVTPTGLPKVFKALTSLDLSDAAKKKLNENYATLVTGGGKKYEEIAPAKNSESESGTWPKVRDAVNFTYTKMMILALLFCRTDETLARLADVIQMEAAYNANGGIVSSGQASGGGGGGAFGGGTIGGRGGGGSRGATGAAARGAVSGAASSSGSSGGGHSSGSGKHDGSFSLNNSYTYIRASGDFSGAYAFSPDKAPWTTKEKHIVYRGY